MLALAFIALIAMGANGACTPGLFGITPTCNLKVDVGVSSIYCCNGFITSGSGVTTCGDGKGPYSDSGCNTPVSNTASTGCNCGGSSNINVGGKSVTLYCCGNSISTSSSDGVATVTCGGNPGPFTDNTCSTAYTGVTATTASPPPPAVASPPPSPPPPPPALPNITCNQFVKFSTPVANTSAFGPYKPSTVTYK